MKEEVKKEILYDLQEALKILEKKETADLEQLHQLSNHAIEDVAVHKDLDLVAVTVLLYSMYKIVTSLREEEYSQLRKEMQKALLALQRNQLGEYNSSIKILYAIVQRCHAKVKVHLQDVMHAARIKKGSILLQKGLSLGQAAGLMGLSNWDLQTYAAKTVMVEPHQEVIPAKLRLQRAFKIFGVSYGK